MSPSLWHPDIIPAAIFAQAAVLVKHVSFLSIAQKMISIIVLKNSGD